MCASPTHSRLKVDEDSTRDVVVIIGLIEEDILAIASISGIVLEHAIR